MVRVHQGLNGHEFIQTLGGSEGQRNPDVLQSTGSQRVGHNLATEQTDTKLDYGDRCITQYIY